VYESPVVRRAAVPGAREGTARAPSEGDVSAGVRDPVGAHQPV